MSELSMQDLAKELARVKGALDALAQTKTTLEAEAQQIVAELLQRMDAAETKSFHLEGLGKFTQVVQEYPRMVGDQERGIAWFDAQGYDVAPRTVKKARVKEAYADLQENDKPLPPSDVVDVYREQTVRFTPVK